MPRRRAAADRTYTQNVTVENDKFRADLYAQQLEAQKAENKALAAARKANTQQT